MDNTRDTEIIEEGRKTVLNFQLYLDMFTSGELPDGKRFDNEFFEMYPFVKPNSPFHMMFCTFVGALDLAQRASRLRRRTKKGLRRHHRNDQVTVVLSYPSHSIL